MRYLRSFLTAASLLLCLSSAALAANCNVGAGTCFWVGGDGTLDGATDSAHWSNTSGGASCACEPTTTSILTFDSNSGAGTGAGGGAKVTFAAGTLTFGEMLMTGTGGFTGTWDWSTNNPNINLSGGTGGDVLSASGTGTRAWNCGTGTLTVATTSGQNVINLQTTTGLSLTCNAGVISINVSGVAANTNASFIGGGQTFGTISISAKSTSSAQPFSFITSALTVGTLNIAAPNFVRFGGSLTFTITNPLSWAGTASNPIMVEFGRQGGTAFTTLNVAASSSISWAVLAGLHFTGNAISPTNCLDMGNNNYNGGTCSPPSGGGSSVGVIIGGQ